MATPTLIYCADGNGRFAEIALRSGLMYGAQLPNTVYYRPYFIDQNWRDPKRAEYMQALAKHRPTLATVLDLEHDHQLGEVLSWAEEAAQYVQDAVILIPKVVGIVSRLPHRIGGKSIRLGYSASSTFSSTPVSISEFRGWPVHCLGGSPGTQMRLARQVDVCSADGNYIQKMARKYTQFYCPSFKAKNRTWPTLREAGIQIAWDAPYVAFTLTCLGVRMAWHGHRGTEIYEAQLSHLRSMGIAPQYTQRRLLA